MRYIYLQESRFFWPARLRGPLDIRAGKDVLQGQGRIGVLGLQQHVTWRGQRVHPSFLTHDLSQVQIFKRVEGGWFEIFRHVHSKVDVGRLRSEESSGQHLRKGKVEEKERKFSNQNSKKASPSLYELFRERTTWWIVILQSQGDTNKVEEEAPHLDSLSLSPSSSPCPPSTCIGFPPLTSWTSKS